VHLDQVLGLAARTIEGVVYVLGRTGGEAGDDVADVEAEDVRGHWSLAKKKRSSRRAAECGQQFPPSNGDCHTPLSVLD